MKIPEWTVGLDPGDEESFYCVLNQDGEAVLEGSLWTRHKEMEQFFQELPPSRVVLGRARTALVNAVRGLVKSRGERLRKCAAERVNVTLAGSLSADLQERLRPLLESIGALSAQITVYDRQIERLAREEYAETQWLQQVWGVGTLLALAFVLILEDPPRFPRSRPVGRTWGCGRGGGTRASIGPNCGSAKKGTRICAVC